ncbi:MAG: UDP-3-O-acyl-N-acetylglucosamine deacetylase [Lactobacillus sp.]|jgi:UDP-3-O-[3-hydroxymyristoyl] N-acetylglucosamine deacetylase|nr:UDP-3-O-acyl-N-acetylglucosamine deacetylase [Lactobacillus sp.]
MQKQQTVSEKVSIRGIGLHSGASAELNILPALENTGIVFKRVDLPEQPEIKALYSNVGDTRNSTTLVNPQGVVVATIEHLMSALYMAGIDNAMIEIDGPEIPIMDGSAQAFYNILKASKLKEQNADRKFLEIKKEVSFSDDRGNTVSLKPHPRLKIDFEINFPSPVVGYQKFNNDIDDRVFSEEIAFCRTFTEKSQIEQLQAMGLIKGGSLDNAVVLDGDQIVNEGGFKTENECVNHKVLDAIGDLYSSGYHVLGELTASKTGHYHTNELLKKMFADKTSYELV